LAACAEQPLRRSIHRRGDVVRRIEDLIEDGLQDLSRFTPGRRRRTDPKATVTAVQPLGTTRATLIEAMIEAKRLADPPAPGPGQRQLLCLYLDPLIEQPFRQQYLRARGDLVKTVIDIVHAGLAAGPGARIGSLRSP
jgi:hypothetical protein